MVKHHPNSLTMWSCRCLLSILNLTRLQRRNRSIHLFLTPNHSYKSSCVLEWLNKSSDLRNLFKQCWHSNGFSPVCDSMCLFKSLGLWNAHGHSVHLWGLLPSWVLMCAFKHSSEPNDFGQTLQWCGLWFVWTTMCLLSSLLVANPMLHSVHLWGLLTTLGTFNGSALRRGSAWVTLLIIGLSCRRMCTLRLSALEHLKSQMWQAKALCPVCETLCLPKSRFEVNGFSQMSQIYGLGTAQSRTTSGSKLGSSSSGSSSGMKTAIIPFWWNRELKPRIRIMIFLCTYV